MLITVSVLWGCPPPDPPAEGMPENDEQLDPPPDVQSLDENDARAELIDVEGAGVGSVMFPPRLAPRA